MNQISRQRFGVFQNEIEFLQEYRTQRFSLKQVRNLEHLSLLDSRQNTTATFSLFRDQFFLTNRKEHTNSSSLEQRRLPVGKICVRRSDLKMKLLNQILK